MKSTHTLRRRMAVCAAASLGLAGSFGAAQGASLVFTELTGVAGGTPAGTAVFRADLSSVGVGTMQSITIRDNSFGLGGSPGRFSGFDLDAIKLSTTSCATAACASGLAGLGVFNFGAGTLFTPGAQRAPADPKLFGTNPAGTAVDNGVATLALFDGNSTTDPTADGFLSMGDGGELSFNLTSAVSTAGLFLYIGEVGDNGEVAAGDVTISSDVRVVPLPGSLPLIAGGLMAGAFVFRRRRPMSAH
ncbi:MAG: PEP-CTERM sorting domain-containing protein [Proteobacteria bacterium]|nr:PEP-CTERM sorting domain-containing protein [Burkholderiales bacterium]